MPLNIGVDFHGTVVDLQKLKEIHSPRFIGIRIKSFWLKSGWIELFRIRKATYDHLLEETCEKWDNFRHAPEIPHAVEKIAQLQIEHNLFLITASGQNAFETAVMWCGQRDIFQPAEKCMHRVERKHSKAQKAKELQLDVFVENDLSRLSEMVVPHRLLLTDVHNINSTLPSGIQRVDSWIEADKIIRSIADNKRHQQRQSQHAL